MTTCSECCLWLVEFLIQSEKISDPHNFDDEDDDDHDPYKPNPPPPPPPTTTGGRGDFGPGGGSNVPGVDTAALGKGDGGGANGEEGVVKEFKRERMKQLFNRHGFNLAVFPGGTVKGKK